MNLSHIIAAAAGAALAVFAAAYWGYLWVARPRRVAYVSLAAAFACALAGGLAQRAETPPAPAPTVRPLPDPDDCVQLGWLNGAWRCIPVEQAG